MSQTNVDVMEPVDEKPSMEGAEGEGDVINSLERKEEPLHDTTAIQEEFTEGVVVDGFGILREYDEDILGYPVNRYTFTNKYGMTAQVIDFGVTITSIRVPDKKGVYDDVVLGFDNLEDYQRHKAAYIGSTIGRVCNRVSHGRFMIDGRVHDISKNVQKSWQLHGGFRGLSFVIWKSRIQGKRVIFSYLSRDGEEGYPGNLLIQMEVWLTDDNGLKMVCRATTDTATPISITNHAYFNLAGHWSGPDAMGEHVVVVNADKYLEVDDYMVPTGEIKHVGGTYLDLRIPRLLSRLIPIIPKGGFDHNYCINGGKQDGVRFVARVVHPKTGRVMEVFSDQPCAVVFTSRNLPTEDEWEEVYPSEENLPSKRSYESLEDESTKPIMKKREVIGKNGAQYLKYSAICIEPQAYPDAVNKPHFPSVILYPGQTYTHTMVFKYSTLVRTKSIRVEAEANGPDAPKSEYSVNDRHHSGDLQSSVDRRYSGEAPTVNYSHGSQADEDVGYADPDYDDDY